MMMVLSWVLITAIVYGTCKVIESRRHSHSSRILLEEINRLNDVVLDLHEQKALLIADKIELLKEEVRVRQQLIETLAELERVTEGRMLDQMVAGEAINAKIRTTGVLEEILRCAGHSESEIDEIIASIEQS